MTDDRFAHALQFRFNREKAKRDAALLMISFFPVGLLLIPFIFLPLLVSGLLPLILNFSISAGFFFGMLGLYCIFCIIMGYYYYRKYASECLYFDDHSLYFERWGRLQWQAECSDILGVFTDSYIWSQHPDDAHMRLMVLLKSGKSLKMPCGLDTPKPGSSQNRFPLFELLKKRGITVPADDEIPLPTGKNELSSILTWKVGMVLFIGGLFCLNVYDQMVSNPLICFNGKNTTTYRLSPWTQLRTLRFTSIEAGTGSNIYIGTESSGVWCFNEGKFSSTGPGLPRIPVKHLFLDETQNTLWAVLSVKEKRKPLRRELFFLESGTWHPFAKKILWEKIIHSLGFDEKRIYVSTDKGLFVFLKTAPMGNPVILFPGRGVLKTFFSGGHLHVLTGKRKIIKSGLYHYTLHRRNARNWEIVFRDKALFEGLMTVDEKGSLWIALDGSTLSNVQTGDSFHLKMAGKPEFRKILFKKGIYLCVFTAHNETKTELPYFRKSIVKRKYVSILRFDPGGEQSYVKVMKEFPFPPNGVDFCIDRKGNIWTYSVISYDPLEI